MNDDNRPRDLALLAARLVLGGSIAAHGAQKLFGLFGGPGPDKAGGSFAALGFPDGRRYAEMAGGTEMAAGALIALGAFGPVGPALLLSVMTVAVETVHRPKGYFNQNGGFEMNTMYALVALLLATQGTGSLSLDRLIGLEKRLKATHGWLALIGGIAGAVWILSQRSTPAPASSTTGEIEQPKEATA